MSRGSVVDCVFYWIWVPGVHRDRVMECTLAEFTAFRRRFSDRFVTKQSEKERVVDAL